MAANLPIESIAAFDNRVPGVHGGCEVVVAERSIALDIEVRRAPRRWAAKTGAGDAQFADDVIDVGALGEVAHDQAGGRNRSGVYHLRRNDVIPREDRILREIIVVEAKAG